jgi:NAD(P)-dependent dehydrogenase (short-subunit alcohol dehydrogenase family)
VIDLRRTVIVAGGSSGIGRAVNRRFPQRGYRVARIFACPFAISRCGACTLTRAR